MKHDSETEYACGESDSGIDRAARQKNIAGSGEGKKKQILNELFDLCRKRQNMVFNTEDISQISARVGFRNPHDAVKIDRSNLLPESLRENDYYLVHLGKGEHKFVRGVNTGFHQFESIPPDCVFDWKYRKSILNQVDTSESNILSVGVNHRIVHDFLYDDIVASPKIYNSRRTKRSLSYELNGELLAVDQLQMELDMTCEYFGRATVFEGKNDFPEDFAVYQLFNPYLYFTALKEEDKFEIGEIDCCYLLRGKGKAENTVRLYLYQFQEKNPASIVLKKCAEYRLIKR